MCKYIDLHVHSTASDGTYAPSALVDLAIRKQLSAIAITDHDSIGGIKEAQEAALHTDLEVIPGVELSTESEGCEIHVVGLYIDPEHPALKKQLFDFRNCRDNRNVLMAERLAQEGFDITYEALTESFPDCVLTRAHIARYLLNTGQVKSLSEVFDKYIGDGCKCYVDRPKISPMEAVALIHQAGGLAFLAHPCLYKRKRQELLHLLDDMQNAGLDGIEAIYSCNQGSDEKDFCQLACQRGLLISGGSDFHGINKPYIKLGTGKGNLKVSYDLLKRIKQSRLK